jgi:carbon starvation protein
MGFWMFKFRKEKTTEATIMGVIMLSLAVIYGKYIPESAFASWFQFDKPTLTILIAAYGFLASVLPVWVLLSPRDYLSSIMKLAVVAMLAVGIIIVMPEMKMPAFTPFIHGGGPVIPGPLFPYLFITIACGAISGFHSIVSSGTTPKMLMKESHIKFVAVGSMLSEGAVSVMALIAASSLFPLDYFQINIPVDKFAQYLPMLQEMGFTESNLEHLSKEVGEEIAGRTGGAVSLAVGMAQIFSAIPGLEKLMSYWYHFAIMFEALFILTIIDAGTRIARYVTQEIMSKIYRPLGLSHWKLSGNILASLFVVFAWGYFVYTGSVSTIWPMFGTANQLLGTIALCIGTSYIINHSKPRYAWITIIPMIFVGVTTMTAGILNIKNIFLPQVLVEATRAQGLVNLILTVIIMASLVIILVDSVPRWVKAVGGRRSAVGGR